MKSKTAMRASDHYTERLVRLPNLSIYYEPPDLQPVSLDREQFGLRPNATVFWCGQSLFKYLPQFDEVFPRIAREAGEFAFIRYGWGTHLDEQFLRRLDRAFASVGLKAADHCVMHWAVRRRAGQHWLVGMQLDAG